jgi:16S rRNA (adenine1518-N6/adenine1519-N6)-dimethyltransferase
MREARGKKFLGQHFLRRSEIAEQMVELGEVGSSDLVVEIGPGKGVLTEKLLGAAREVIAIEKDEQLVFFLSLKFKNEIKAGKLTLVKGDALSFEPADYLLQAGGYKLIANIPYYITGAILRRFFSEVVHPSTVVLMIQKEVAERIVARGGKESVLSLAIKAYGVPTLAMRVGRGAFQPPPKVDSAVLLVKNISRKRFNHFLEEKIFFNLIKTGFASRRKTILSNLKKITGKKLSNRGADSRLGDLTFLKSGEDGWGEEKGEVVKSAAEWLRSCGVEPSARAEDLSLKKWLCLSARLAKNYRQLSFGESVDYRAAPQGKKGKLE